MEYITSRSFDLPTDKEQMESSDWFNMWKRRNFLYKEILIGDILYWFETKTQQLVWKTKIISVERYPYSDKKLIFDRYKNSLGQQYNDSRPNNGYFVGYKVKVIERIRIPKPANYRFSELGWVKVDKEIAHKWFKRDELEDDNTLDDITSFSDKSITEQLEEINKKMQNVLPQRINKVVLTTIRKDTKIINAIKGAAHFKCQFPNCGHQIKKKDGSFYIEVAHIKPVCKNGQSILGNLLVLCPNHHKEFDYGNVSITEQTMNKL